MNPDIQRHFLDYLPLWGNYLLTIGLCLLSVEIGFRLGRYWRLRHPDEDKSDIGTILGATLGLWAFLLAFLVGMATTRYEERRSLVVQEANSIGTTYLRAGYLLEPYASRSRELLREYAKTRVNFNKLEGFKTAVNATPTFHASLWDLAQELAKSTPSNPIYSIYITSLNETIDLHTSRVAALTTSRVPYTIYVGLYIVAVLALFMLGFNSGLTGKRNWIVSIVFILVFSAIMILVIDLDRPWGGFLTVSQQPMIDLINSFSTFK
jgi:hypothetical protein